MQENQRVRLSKQLLRDSLIRLMKTKSIHKISIKEICDSAEVNRSTFYKHYNTEYDLLKDIENDYIDSIERYIDFKDSNISILNLLKYVEQNIDVFRLFLSNSPNNEFFQNLIKKCTQIMTLNDKLEKHKDISRQEYIYEFILFGCISVVQSWIMKDKREPPEVMNDTLLNLVGRFWI